MRQLLLLTFVNYELPNRKKNFKSSLKLLEVNKKKQKVDMQSNLFIGNKEEKNKKVDVWSNLQIYFHGNFRRLNEPLLCILIARK